MASDPPRDWVTIAQPLSFGAPDRLNRALAIRGLAMVPAERKFIAIAVKVLLADMVERSHNAALKQSKIRLDFVRAGVAAYILAFAMIDGVMSAKEPTSDFSIGAKSISHESGAAVHILVDDFS
jgi:hypothetical protein